MPHNIDYHIQLGDRYIAHGRYIFLLRCSSNNPFSENFLRNVAACYSIQIIFPLFRLFFFSFFPTFYKTSYLIKISFEKNENSNSNYCKLIINDRIFVSDIFAKLAVYTGEGWIKNKLCRRSLLERESSYAWINFNKISI